MKKTKYLYFKINDGFWPILQKYSTGVQRFISIKSQYIRISQGRYKNLVNNVGHKYVEGSFDPIDEQTYYINSLKQ